MFNKIKKILSVLFFLAAFFIGCWIYIENPQLISLTLLGFSFTEQSLGLLLLLTFVLGILLGLFGNVLVMSWMALKIKRLSGSKAVKTGS